MGVLSKLFSKKKRVLEPADLSILGADMHSHLIPGIDDGAPDLTTSLSLIKELKKEGYRHLITTPHVMSDYYRNTTDIILRGRDTVLAALEEQSIKIGFETAAEYFLDEYFMELIHKKELLTFGNNYVLFEMSFIAEPPQFKEALFEMQMAGYQPILAHPERYTYWHRDNQKYHELVERDVLLQVNINSLTGIYSPEVMTCGEDLIEEGLVNFLGTDCHHKGHLDLMRQAKTTSAIHNLLNSGNLWNANLVRNKS